MADFISKDLQRQTVAPETYDAKIKLNKNEVNIQFLESRDVSGTFRIKYIVNINTKGRKLDPKKEMKPSNIDMQTLRDGIVSKLKPYDAKYMTLTTFDDRMAIFEFNHEKWLRDATKGIKGKVYYSKFDREFKLKIQPPMEIRKDVLSIKFEKFITRKFLDWLEKHERLSKGFFSYLIPKNQQKKVRTKIRNMFDWSYDAQWNRVVAKLKNIYIIALMYATGSALKKMSQKNISKSKKELFSTKVKNNINSFDRKKWEDFTRKKFF